MEIIVNAVKFKPTAALTEFIEKKAKKIETQFPQAIKTEVNLKVDKDQAVNNKVADVRVFITGYDLFASKRCDTFEEAVDKCMDAIKTQIDKEKGRWNN